MVQAAPAPMVKLWLNGKDARSVVRVDEELVLLHVAPHVALIKVAGLGDGCDGGARRIEGLLRSIACCSR